VQNTDVSVTLLPAREGALLRDDVVNECIVEPGFGAVADAFRANFDTRGEVGAAVCVYVDGRPVVDLWGGVANRATGQPWERDTITGVFSSTKGVTAVCVNALIERGRLDPDAAVATYWPEFAAAGKADITVRQVMSHQAGLPYVEGDFTLDEALSWEPVVQQLARQAPIWEPGAQHGYHMRTYGWLAGELVRRVTGASVGSFLREEIAGPLGVDFWIGLPETEEPRVAPLVPPETDLRAALAAFGDTLLLARVFGNPSELFNYDDMWNARQLHACELPSSNGIGNARALSRLYASLVGDGVDGVRTLQPDTLTAAAREQVRGRDAVIMVESAFGIGFMLGATFGAANPPSAIGHAGAGGSLSFCDPEPRVGFGYVMNDLRFDAKGDPRSESLVRACYQSLEHARS
jgi:CubicO group peptidase (beta-lactamase class C family)